MDWLVNETTDPELIDVANTVYNIFSEDDVSEFLKKHNVEEINPLELMASLNYVYMMRIIHSKALPDDKTVYQRNMEDFQNDLGKLEKRAKSLQEVLDCEKPNNNYGFAREFITSSGKMGFKYGYGQSCPEDFDPSYLLEAIKKMKKDLAFFIELANNLRAKKEYLVEFPKPERRFKSEAKIKQFIATEVLPSVYEKFWHDRFGFSTGVTNKPSLTFKAAFVIWCLKKMGYELNISSVKRYKSPSGKDLIK